MPRSRQNANYNGRLTNYAYGQSQDLASALADFLAPQVVVSASIGQYKKYDEKNAFQVYDTARAMGGAAARIKFEATDPTYNCKPQALEITVDDAERDAAGEEAMAQQALDESKVNTVLGAATVSHEDKVLAAIKLGVAAVGGVGAWSVPATNNPIVEIDAQIKAITIASGMLPNRIAFGIGAWSYFRNHDKVIARFPNAANVGVTKEQASGLFLNPSMQVAIGVLSKDAAKWGNTKSAANIVGDEVFVFFANPAPSIYDPSFAKTFVTRRGSVNAVRTYRDESARSDVHALDWSEDIQVVSTALVKRITVT
jgi:hypothetical protein